MATNRNKPVIGELAPQFCLPNASSQEICLDSYRGKWVVLYFYSKDNTSGWTLEAVEFSGALDELSRLNADVVGVNPDTALSHSNFAQKHSLRVQLLSDTEKKVLDQYGAWQNKKLYGKESMGVVRSTFLIDPVGKIAYIWPKVTVQGHADAVKQKIIELQAQTKSQV